MGGAAGKAGRACPGGSSGRWHCRNAYQADEKLVICGTVPRGPRGPVLDRPLPPCGGDFMGSAQPVSQSGFARGIGTGAGEGDDSLHVPNPGEGVTVDPNHAWARGGHDLRRRECRSKGSLPAVQDRLHETGGPCPVGPGETGLTGPLGKRPVIRQQTPDGVGHFSFG